MKKLTLCFFIIFILSMLFYVNSCDMILTSDSDPILHELIIKVVIHDKYINLKDEVLVDTTGVTRFQRLEGEKIPTSFRRLSNEEFRYIKNLFENFYSLNDEYIADGVSGTVFTITYYGEQGEKTVRCDNSIFNYQLWDPEYYILIPIVNSLRDLQISLIGEGKFVGKLSFDLKPEKTTVNLDEPVVLQYSVTNKTNQKIVLPFANIQQLGYKVYHKGKLLNDFPWGFLPALSSWEIPPASTETKQTVWEHRIQDDIGFYDRKAKSGTYTIVQYLLDGNSPYQANEVTIKEEGDEYLQARVIHNFSIPRMLTYDLNNRVSREHSFQFTMDRKVGIKITHRDTGEIVYIDTTGNSGASQLIIEPFGDFYWSETWDVKDEDGNLLPKGYYVVEMWLLEQTPNYRASRNVVVFY